MSKELLASGYRSLLKIQRESPLGRKPPLAGCSFSTVEKESL